MPDKIKNKDGVSLVEVMIALAVFLIAFSGIMQAALISIDSNVRNILRDEAISIAAARMEDVRSQPFTAIVSDTASIPSGANCPSTFTTGSLLQRNIRDMTNDFCINLTCQELGGDGNCATSDTDNKQVSVRVTWKWKGEDYLHSVTTLRRR
jgi:prepilin-type N-terminal cleavage/methylation domain-containing protein